MSIPFTFIWEYPNPSPPSQRLCHGGCPVHSVNIDNYALLCPMELEKITWKRQNHSFLSNKILCKHCIKHSRAYLIRQNRTKIQTNTNHSIGFSNWISILLQWVWLFNHGKKSNAIELNLIQSCLESISRLHAQDVLTGL